MSLSLVMVDFRSLVKVAVMSAHCSAVMRDLDGCGLGLVWDADW